MYNQLPDEIKAKVAKAFDLFRQNPGHPSLGVKKMQGFGNRYEGRIDQSYRFTSHFEEDIAVFTKIGKHDILDDETD